MEHLESRIAGASRFPALAHTGRPRTAIPPTVSALLAALIFTSLMMLPDWERWSRSGTFNDRNNYINLFHYHQSILEYQDFSSLLDYATNEILWHVAITYLVRDLNINLNSILAAISALTLMTFGFLVASRVSKLALFLLINPLIIDLAFSQSRSALCVSVLVLAMISQRKWLGISLAAVTPFIHTSAVLFTAMYFSGWTVTKYFGRKRSGSGYRFIALVLVGLFFSVLIGPLREALLSAIDDRRALTLDLPSSFQYMSFWILLLSVVFISRGRFRFDSDISFATIILSLVTFNTFFGTVSMRFLSCSLPFFIKTIFALPPKPRAGTLACFVAYAVTQWYYWL